MVVQLVVSLKGENQMRIRFQLAPLALALATALASCVDVDATPESFKVGNHVVPCPHNPLGVKGVGEVGAIGVPPAVIGAVLDALAPLGVKDISMPATPEKVWTAIQNAKRERA